MIGASIFATLCFCFIVGLSFYMNTKTQNGPWSFLILLASSLLILSVWITSNECSDQRWQDYLVDKHHAVYDGQDRDSPYTWGRTFVLKEMPND
jgi:high-affinity Fe2+/Pb2+ permease